MPRASPHLAIGASVSVKPHFLNSKPIIQALRTVVALNGPGIKLMGNIEAESSLNGRAAWSVKLDQLPDQLVSLLGTSLRFEGGRPAAHSAPRTVTSSQESVQDETIDLMEDALPVPGEFGPGDNEEEEMDLCWREGEVTVDVRSASPAEAYRGHCILHLPARSSLLLHNTFCVSSRKRTSKK